MSHMAEMGRLTKELSRASRLRTSAVDEMRRATQATLAACASMRGETMRNHRGQTQKFLAALAKDVSSQRHATAKRIKRMTSARSKAGAQTRVDLEDHVFAIMERAAQIRNAAAETGRSLSTAHREMARQQKAALGTGRRKLRADVTRLLRSARRQQQAVRADLQNAHNVWSAFARGKATPRKRRAH